MARQRSSFRQGPAALLTAALCAAVVLILAPAQAAAQEAATAVAGGEDLVTGSAPSRLSLAYRLYAGGLPAFSSESEVTLRPQGYDVRLALRPEGWLAWLLDFSLEANAVGASGPKGLAPSRYRADSLWSGSERWVQITYDGDGTPVTLAEPAKDDHRDRVPPALQAGTVDPITAALELLHVLQRGGRCEGKAAIFDGRRRFAAQAEHGGQALLSPSEFGPFGGPATICRLRLVPVAGFFKKDEHPPKPRRATVYLRRLLPGWPPLPVRIEADTRYGALRGHLVSMTQLAPAERAAR